MSPQGFREELAELSKAWVSHSMFSEIERDMWRPRGNDPRKLYLARKVALMLARI